MKALIGFIIIIIIGISIAVTLNLKHYSDDPESPYNRNENNRLKVYSPFDVNPDLVDSSLQDKKKNHTIADFAFVNQLGDTITKTDVTGKIYVTDFFFYNLWRHLSENDKTITTRAS